MLGGKWIYFVKIPLVLYFSKKYSYNNNNGKC